MRPLKLEMCAFGPYKDKVFVDFECMGEQGIYLITGDTGSGKTTIFDAISFALFGTASGSRRENGSFRSDFAEDQVKTYVKLEFQHKDVCYQIERIPRYFRKKIRGEGNTAVGGEATLTFLDQVVTGDKNVTNKCIEILGIQASQFKQIAMIAQGEFMDLLLADSRSRASIFRHIFDTVIYKDIGDKLKEKYLEKRREYEEDDLLISRCIDRVIWDQEGLEEKSTSEVLELLNKEIVRDKKKELELEQEKEGLLKLSLDLVQKISEGKILNDHIDNLGMFENKLKQLKCDEKEILQWKDLLEKNRLIWESVNPKYQEFLRVEKEIQEKKKLLDSNQMDYQEKCLLFEEILVHFKDLTNLEKEVSILKEERMLWKEKLKILEELDQINTLIHEKDLLLQQVSWYEKKGLLKKFQNLHSLENKLTDSRKRFVKLKEDYERQRQEYLKNYDLFLSAQAGILAKELKENCPCPVCGSLDHPNKANSYDFVLSKEELDSFRELVEDVQRKVEKFSLDIRDTESFIEGIRKELENFSEDILKEEVEKLQRDQKWENLDNEEVLSFDKKEIELELHGLKVKREEFLKKLKEDDYDFVSRKLGVLEDNILKLENKIGETRVQYDTAVQDKVRLESIIQILKKDLDDLILSVEFAKKEYVFSYQSLGYEKEDDYLKIQLDRESMISYEEKVKSYDDKIQSLTNQIAVLRNFVNGKDKVNLEELELEKLEIDEKLKYLEVSLKEKNSKLSNNVKSYEELKFVYNKSTKLEQEVMIYKDLSDTASGTITGKNKLEFEQYVQAFYFDLVILDANKRFLSMTEDRYQLVRKEESLKLSDKLGLELEVLDYYTGKRRDIRSLSGGESFKAALSLALGMSDTIQQFAGGVVVDAMFIDEGFGSLDEESLEQALNAILMLSQGDRVIGIISHVNELKNRIDKKIVVKKSSSGSSVHILI